MPEERIEGSAPQRYVQKVTYSQQRHLASLDHEAWNFNFVCRDVDVGSTFWRLLDHERWSLDACGRRIMLEIHRAGCG